MCSEIKIRSCRLVCTPSLSPSPTAAQMLRFLLFVDALPPHEDLGLTVQRKRPVILPEAIKQLHVFELPVFVAH